MSAEAPPVTDPTPAVATPQQTLGTRLRCLELAIASRNEGDASNQIVDRAAAYETFLQNTGV